MGHQHHHHNPTTTKQPQFVLEASEAESMAKSLNLPSVLHLLPHLVPSAQSLARPLISNFHVGTAGLGSDGRVFFGVNVEFLGVPLHHSVHAEQFLVTNLAVHSCPRLLALAVSAAPCGHCRQFLQELRHSSDLQILILDERQFVNNDNENEDDQYIDINNNSNNDRISSNFNFKPLSRYLPDPFGPHDLLDRGTPLLLEQRRSALDLAVTPNDTDHHHYISSNGNVNYGNGNCETEETVLMKAALEAAGSAHAPYSGCPSGVALMDCEGKVYKGSYAESAAYNPSFGPVQAALVAYIASGGGGYERIVAAALVETEGAKVRQEDTARLLLKAIAPKCELRVFHCQLSH